VKTIGVDDKLSQKLVQIEKDIMDWNFKNDNDVFENTFK